jgi:hypothetical protein
VIIFCCLRVETPPTWRTRSRIYIPQEQGGPVIPPGTVFPFHRLLRLAGLRWRYSNPHPRGVGAFTAPLHSGSHRKHRSSNVARIFTPLFHSNGCTRHISYRDSSSTVACGHYLAMVLFLWLYSSCFEQYATIIIPPFCTDARNCLLVIHRKTGYRCIKLLKFFIGTIKNPNI